MCGTFTRLAEIVWRSDQSFAEMPLPDTVDHHARGQRVAGLREPFGELQSPAARERRLCVVTRENRREAFRRGLAGIVVIASNEYFLLDRVAVFDRARHFRFLGRGLLQLFLLFAERSEPRQLLGREILMTIFSGRDERPILEIHIVEETVIARLEFGLVGKRSVLGKSPAIFRAPFADLFLPFGEAFLEALLIAAGDRGELVGSGVVPLVQIAAHVVARLQEIDPSP